MTTDLEELPDHSAPLGKITPKLYARACILAARRPKDKPLPRLYLDETGRPMSCAEIIRWWQTAVFSAGKEHKGSSFLLRSVSVYATGDYGEECCLIVNDSHLEE